MLVTAFADAKELRAVAARVLPWDESQPGGHVAAVLELATIADGGHYGGRNLRPDPFDLCDPLRKRTCSEGLIDASVEYCDTTVDLT